VLSSTTPWPGLSADVTCVTSNNLLPPSPYVTHRHDIVNPSPHWRFTSFMDDTLLLQEQYVIGVIRCLHDPCSERPANVQQFARLFWIHLLEVCWTFARLCKYPIK